MKLTRINKTWATWIETPCAYDAHAVTHADAMQDGQVRVLTVEETQAHEAMLYDLDWHPTAEWHAAQMREEAERIRRHNSDGVRRAVTALVHPDLDIFAQFA